MDEALLRGILNAQAKVPLESLFLETGAVPIRYILKTRRLGYHKTILQRDPEELVSEIFTAQKSNPTEGDFCLLIKDDSNEVNLVLKET